LIPDRGSDFLSLPQYRDRLWGPNTPLYNGYLSPCPRW